jgi:hypothetical protein
MQKLGFASSLFAASVLLGGNTYTASDVQAMVDLGARGAQLVQDDAAALGSVSPRSQEAACLSKMTDDLFLIISQVEHMRSLLGIAAKMVDEKDEAFVLRVTQVVGNQLVNQYAVIRSDLNRASSACSETNVASAQIEKVHDYLDAVATATTAALTKIH